MNDVILSIILAGFGAQLLKLLLLYFKHKSLSFHDLALTGGMPSSHSAFVVSLATAIYLTEGPTTTFAIALVFALIVIRDAYGVRRSVGKEGEQIKKLLQAHHIKSKFHYSMGHTPMQVLVGAIIGLIVPLAIFLL